MNNPEILATPGTHLSKKIKHKNTTQHRKQKNMSNTDPTKKPINLYEHNPLLVKRLNNVVIIKTKIYLPQS
jgi:hypothetical protein